MQFPLTLIFTIILSLLTFRSVALPLGGPILPSEFVPPPKDTPPTPPGLPDGGGQSAGNIAVASGALMEIGLLVAGMGLWV